MPIQGRLDALLYLLQVTRDPEALVQAAREALALAEDPETTAYIRVKLADGLSRLEDGNSVANIREAVAALVQSLRVYTRELRPSRWAEVQMALGDCYREQGQGERAIARYTDALRVRDRDTGLSEWAATTMALGMTYTSLPGDRAAHIERALAAFRSVAESLSPSEHRDELAAAEHAVGVAYSARILGDRAANVERAISALEASLLHSDRERDPRNWAATRHALGAAYDYRLEGDRADNLARAYEHFEQALDATRSHGSPAELAGGLTSLGLLCAKRGEQADIQTGIDCLEEALTLRTSTATPDLWAHSKSVLALLYERRAERAGRPPTLGAEPVPPSAIAEDLERARTHLEDVCAVQSHRITPHRLATCHAALGYVYQRRMRGSRSDNLRAAAGHYRQSLGALAVDPLRYVGAAARLGEVCAELGRWDEAAHAFASAADAADRSYSAALTTVGRDDALQSGRAVSTWMGYALAKIGRTHEAAVAFERGRARALGDALDRDHAELERLARSEPEAFAAYRDASARLRGAGLAELEAVAPDQIDPAAPAAPGGRAARADEAERAAADLARAIERIRAIDGYERFLERPDIFTVGGAAEPGRPLAYLACTPRGSLTLLVQQSAASGIVVDEIWEDGFTQADLANLLHRVEGVDAPTAGLVARVLGTITYTCKQTGEVAAVEGPMTDEELTAIANAMAELSGRPPHEGVLTWDISRSARTDDDGVSVFGQRVVAPLARRLRELGAGAVTLVPCGRLGLLPAHTVDHAGGVEPRRLIDDFDVAFAPSARVVRLARAGLRAAPSRTPTLAGVGNPLPHPNPLEFAAYELEQVARHFGRARPLYGDAATRDALFAAADGATHVHLACHGAFRLGDPSPRLELAGRERLTPPEISARRPFASARLVVMSACQSAISGVTDAPDEVVGLPSAVMAAGVPGVIGTLWPVDDLSTTLLMGRFYELHLRGDRDRREGPMEPDRALRMAQLWLANVTAGELRDLFGQDDSLRPEGSPKRDRYPAAFAAEQAYAFAEADPASKPFSDGYYWEPFVFVGV